MDSVHVLFGEVCETAMHTLCMAKNGETGSIDELARECGRRLAECRRERSMTQGDLSKATGYRVRKGGLSASQIGNFEQGTRRIRFEEAEILATVFTDHVAGYFMGAVDKRESKMLVLLRAESPPLTKAG